MSTFRRTAIFRQEPCKDHLLSKTLPCKMQFILPSIRIRPYSEYATQDLCVIETCRQLNKNKNSFLVSFCLHLPLMPWFCGCCTSGSSEFHASTCHFLMSSTVEHAKDSEYCCHNCNVEVLKNNARQCKSDGTLVLPEEAAKITPPTSSLCYH